MRRRKGALRALLVSLFFMYLTTGILLIFLSVVVFRFHMSTPIARLFIILTYIISGFVGGFLIGRIRMCKKYLWGIAAGILYFVVLLFTSRLIGGGCVDNFFEAVLIFVLCTASAMLGGMVS